LIDDIYIETESKMGVSADFLLFQFSPGLRVVLSNDHISLFKDDEDLS